MPNLLTYTRVSIAYGATQAVRSVSFSVNAGEILGIVGESGSGKSTLIRAAMGLLGSGGRVASGDILYKGESLVNLSPARQRRLNGPELGMIFQNAGAAFCPIRTVGAQLYECMAEHGRVTRAEFIEQAESMLRDIGFENPHRILDSYPFELSGGMQQRVGIAAAMLLRPGVLFADEPTSALDVSVQKQVVEEMLKARDALGASIVIVTHNIGVIGAMADHVMVMQGGEMVEYGPTREVLDCPRQAYTQRLMAAVPRLRR